MYCTECGAEIPDDTNFCRHCGKAVISKQVDTSPPIYQPSKQPSTLYKIGMTLAVIVLFIIFIGANLLIIFGSLFILQNLPRIGITMIIIGVIILVIYVINGIIAAKRQKGLNTCEFFECFEACPY
ncbi:MAG: zinc-ribbon domain-containing protein [Promethearchaeota archaeon]